LNQQEVRTLVQEKEAIQKRYEEEKLAVNKDLENAKENVKTLGEERQVSECLLQ
jgi:hypothetical protein